MSKAKIYDPTTAVANPNYDPTQPTGPNNFPYTRSQFQDNKIPLDRINPQLEAFLMQHLPMPNMMMDNPGVDSNNYLDIRNENHSQDQGTVRVDHIFQNNDTVLARYSVSAEHGFSPSSGMTATTENLPGFGANFDNLSQQAGASWNHVFSSTKLNTVSLAFSRLSMDRTSQNNGVNDFVTQLGIQGVGFGGKGAWGAPWFAAQGYTGIGDTFAATPMHAWDTTVELRDTFAWQRGRHALKFGGDVRKYIWPMWGFFQNRGYYQFTNGFTTQTATNDGTGSALASFLLGLPAVKQRQAGIPQMQLRQWYADAFVQDSFQVTRNTTIQMGLRYEFMSPLRDIRYANTNLTFVNGVPFVFIGGQQDFPVGLTSANKLNFAPRVGISHNMHKHGIVLHAAFGIFFTPVDMNTWCNQLHNPPLVFAETNPEGRPHKHASVIVVPSGTPGMGIGPAPICASMPSM